MIKHQESSEYAGKEIEVIDKFNHKQYPNLKKLIIEDWWDRIAGKSWMDMTGNPACLVYAIRTATSEYSVPIDDNVLYGKYYPEGKNGLGFGVLIHISEIKKN